MATESDDMAHLAMQLRDELRGTESGHDPWAGIRLMRYYEQREFQNEDGPETRDGPPSGTESDAGGPS